MLVPTEYDRVEMRFKNEHGSTKICRIDILEVIGYREHDQAETLRLGILPLSNKTKRGGFGGQILQRPANSQPLQPCKAIAPRIVAENPQPPCTLSGGNDKWKETP